jgi:protein-S-isoprenylcysteine O-methyltransferase Ste14
MILAVFSTCIASIIPVVIYPAINIVGVVVAILSLDLLLISHHYLGDNFSGLVHIRPNHQFIKSGPYAYIRHPIYTATIGLVIGYLLMTCNPLVLVWLPLLLELNRRIPLEEEIMIRRFGFEYVKYKVMVGCLIPKRYHSKNM